MRLPHNPRKVTQTKYWMYGKLDDGTYILTSTNKNASIMINPDQKKYFGESKEWIMKTFKVNRYTYDDYNSKEWYFILTEKQFLMWVMTYLKDLDKETNH
jgi:hypothetical protein